MQSKGRFAAADHCVYQWNGASYCIRISRFTDAISLIESFRRRYLIKDELKESSLIERYMSH